MFDSTVVEAPPDDVSEAADWRAGFQEHADPREPGFSPAQAQPSGWLALELDAGTAGAEVLGDAGLVDAIIAFDHVASWAAARQARLIAEFARRRPGDDPAAVCSDKPSLISRYAPDEIGLALGLSRLTAKSRIGQAIQLTEVLSDTLMAWEAGRIDASKVRAICDATLILCSEDAVAVQHRVLPRAGERSLAQLRAALARAIAAVDPEGAAARHREARKDRRVVVGDEKEGMASLWARLAAPTATSAYQWLSRLARGLGEQDPRGMDARRADILADLLTGQLTVVADNETGAAVSTRPGTSEPGTAEPGTSGTRPEPAVPGKPLIHIVMPHSTLLGADDHPAELVGYGPIPADLAREIAADAVWKRLVTDPLSGALLDHGRTTYRPPAALADFVRARDVTCRFPTCRRRTLDTELDHNQAWAEDGTTSDENLWGGCPHHHHLKHDAGWTVTLHPDGAMTWTTPTGHDYTSDPHDYRPEPLLARRSDPPATLSRAGPAAGCPDPPDQFARLDAAQPGEDDDPPSF